MPREFSRYHPTENYNTFVSEQRYSFARVEADGQEAFLKQANSPEVAPKLERELLWHDYMTDFTKAHPQLRTRSPQVFLTDERRILFEFVDAPFLGTVDDVSSLEPVVPRLSRLLLDLDAFGGGWQPSRHVSTDTDNAPWNHVDKSWTKWTASALGRDVITEDKLADAIDILNSCRHRLTPRMQHGDFNPWHIFKKGEEWIIFDGENSSVDKARFYDLAYFYSRVFTRAQNHAIPARLLTEFVAGLDMPEQDFFESFLPLLTSRALGIFMDAVHDRDQIDYMADAVELFERCKSRQLSALTSP